LIFFLEFFLIFIIFSFFLSSSFHLLSLSFSSLFSSSSSSSSSSSFSLLHLFFIFLFLFFFVACFVSLSLMAKESQILSLSFSSLFSSFFFFFLPLFFVALLCLTFFDGQRKSDGKERPALKPISLKAIVLPKTRNSSFLALLLPSSVHLFSAFLRFDIFVLRFAIEGSLNLLHPSGPLSSSTGALHGSNKARFLTASHPLFFCSPLRYRRFTEPSSPVRASCPDFKGDPVRTNFIPVL
jgi:hypothetical protein